MQRVGAAFRAGQRSTRCSPAATGAAPPTSPQPLDPAHQVRSGPDWRRSAAAPAQAPCGASVAAPPSVPASARPGQRHGRRRRTGQLAPPISPPQPLDPAHQVGSGPTGADQQRHQHRRHAVHRWRRRLPCRPALDRVQRRARRRHAGQLAPPTSPPQPLDPAHQVGSGPTGTDQQRHQHRRHAAHRWRRRLPCRPALDHGSATAAGAMQASGGRRPVAAAHRSSENRLGLR